MEILDRLLSFVSAMPSTAIQGLIWGIMAIGVYITYKILDVADLTVDGSIVTGMAVCAVSVEVAKLPVWLGIVLAMIAGMAAGLITGLIHTLLGIPAILAGILTQLILWSLNLQIMSGKSSTAYNANRIFFISTRDDIPWISYRTIGFLVLIVLVVVIALYWFFGTELGASIRATGCNPIMSCAQGINNNRNKVIGLVLSNGIVALSGACLSFLQGSANINAGRGAIVTGLAAVVIAESLFMKLTKSNFALKLLSVAVGGVIYYLVYQFVVSFKLLPSNYLKMLSAVIVAVFLAIPYLKKKYFSKIGKKKEGKKHA